MNLNSRAPVTFDNMTLESLISDWMESMSEFNVDAVVVLGPDPFGRVDDRLVTTVHPPRLLDAAWALAESREFGAPWRESHAPLVAWQHIAKSAFTTGSRWRRLWLANGYQSVVRVEFPLPAQRAFECFMFSPRELADRAEAAALAWSALNVWPLLKRALAQNRGSLSPRECECLALAFEGKTARETGVQLSCSERTVNYHLANAMAKLKVDNKMAAIQRACWLGAL